MPRTLQSREVHPAVHVMAAILVVVVSSPASGQGVYEFDSFSYAESHPGGVLARIEVNTLPVSDLAHFDSLTLLDPTDETYRNTVTLTDYFTSEGLVESFDGYLGGAWAPTLQIASLRFSASGEAPEWARNRIGEVMIADWPGGSFFPTIDFLVPDPQGLEQIEGQWIFVPEPSSVTLLLMAMVTWGRRARQCSARWR